MGINSKKPMVSIVIPCFNEENILSESIAAIQDNLDKTSYNYEVLIIDDGSYDNTFAIIKNKSVQDSRVKGVRLTRNFGKEAAIYAGIEKARGDCAVVLDADLQHPPTLLGQMINLWHREDYLIVEAVKVYENEKKKNRWTYYRASLFNYLMTKFTGFNMHGASDYKLLDRKVVNTILQLSEKIRLFRGLVTWTGYKTKRLYIEVPERIGGKTKWSLLSLFRLTVSAITSFSNIPLQIITTLGIITLLFCFFLFTHTLYQKFSGNAVSGFATVIILSLFLNSVIMISLGIIGVYLANIYSEIKGRPIYLVAEETILPYSNSSSRSPINKTNP